METRFTKGPWHIDAMKNVWSRDSVKIVDTFGRPTSDSSYRQVSEDEHAANTALIAAAPELYDALDDLAEWHAWSLDQAERAADEFKRATGFLAPFKDSPAAAGPRDNQGAVSAWREWYATQSAKRIYAARAALAKARGE